MDEIAEQTLYPRFAHSRLEEAPEDSPVVLVHGPRQGKTVLVQMRDAMDPETGQRFTVKRYESEKVKDGDSWRHARIALKPVNPDFEPIVLTGAEGGELQVIAEFVEVLSLEALQQKRQSEEATNGHRGLDS
jgi:hypothetical protein